MPPSRRRVQPWMFVAAAWIVPAVLAAVDTMAQHLLWGGMPAPFTSVLFMLLDWLLYAFLTPFVFMLSRRWPLARGVLAPHAMMHLLASLLFCAAWAAGGVLLRLLLEPRSLERGLAFHFTSWLFITLPFGVAVYLAVVGIEHAIRWFTQARERDVQVAQLSEQLAGARFAALQARLNPHFLFNTLNTIAVRVRDADTGGATRMIEQLSDVLRRTLSEGQAEVTLADELDLVRQYLAIEQARFSDRLRITFDVDGALVAAAVPAFAVQHLVENAIRHGIARRADAGRLSVRARRDGDLLEIEVRDDGVGVADVGAPFSGTPRGLAQTRERLTSLYGERASLTLAGDPAGGAVATLRLPFREIDGAR